MNILMPNSIFWKKKIKMSAVFFLALQMKGRFSNVMDFAVLRLFYNLAIVYKRQNSLTNEIKPLACTKSSSGYL